jgi:hypothetical protein
VEEGENEFGSSFSSANTSACNSPRSTTSVHSSLQSFDNSHSSPTSPLLLSSSHLATSPTDFSLGDNVGQSSVSPSSPHRSVSTSDRLINMLLNNPFNVAAHSSRSPSQQEQKQDEHTILTDFANLLEHLLQINPQNR